MNFKVFFIILLFSIFHQFYFYCADKRLNHQELSLFFPSPKLQISNDLKNKVSLLEDQRLQLLAETVYKAKLNKEAKRSYIMALDSEIDRRFEQADQFAIQGYREAFKAQPYGKLLEQQDSLVFHLWNLLHDCSLEEDVVSLIKKSLWQETQRNVDSLENITLEDIALLNRINGAYDLYLTQHHELPSKEKVALSFIKNIVNEVNRAEQSLKERLQVLKREELKRREEEGLQALEIEFLKILGIEGLQRVIEKKSQEIERKQLELIVVQEFQRLKEFMCQQDKKRQVLIDKIMNYRGCAIDKNSLVWNTSLYNSFNQDKTVKIASLLDINHLAIDHRKPIDQRELFDKVKFFLKSEFTGVAPYYHSWGILCSTSNRYGRMDTRIIEKHRFSKGFLRLSAIPEILALADRCTKSYIDHNRHDVFVLSSTLPNRDYMQCVILPEFDLLFYQIDEHSDSKPLEEQSDSKQSNSALGAAGVISSSSPPPLPTWTVPKVFENFKG
jgi:hypothetical protein